MKLGGKQQVFVFNSLFKKYVYGHCNQEHTAGRHRALLHSIMSWGVAHEFLPFPEEWLTINSCVFFSGIDTGELFVLQ